MGGEKGVALRGVEKEELPFFFSLKLLPEHSDT